MIMMGKPRKESPPLIQANGRTSGFKIPKKKADDWCEEVQVSSPLSRLANPEFRNVTLRKRANTSSYESYNVPRNMESHAYYTSHGNYKLYKEPKVILTDVLRSDSGRQSTQNNIIGSNSCNDATFQISPISSPTSKTPSAYPALKGSSETLRLSRTERNSGLQNEVESSHEVEIGTKPPENRRSLEPKEQTQEKPFSKVCRDVSNTSTSSHKDVNLGPRKSSSLERGSPDSVKVSEPKTPIKNNIGSPNIREQTYCCKRAEYQNKKTLISPSKVPVQTPPSYLLSSSSEPSSDGPLDSPDATISSRGCVNETNEQNKKSLRGGCSVALPAASFLSRSHTNRLSKRKMHQKSTSRENIVVEPIVLSSDEEERGHEKHIRADCAQAVQDSSIEMKDDVFENQCPSPSNDAVPMDCSATVVDAVPASEASVLQLKFLNAYFGKRKGRATDSVKFTSKSIEIPVKVALHEMTCLLVDTWKVHKYGLWLTNGAECIRSSAVIMLWLSKEYVPHIAKQVDPTSGDQTSKSDEFIFLELVEPLTSQEQSVMSEIMVDASKNGSSTLSDILSWEEMHSLLEALSPKECSFKENCFSQFKSQQHQESSCASLPVTPPEAIKVKSYSVMQKYRDGHYSVSVLPRQDGTLKEIHRGGSPLRLLVYPPPPTKGGLGVSNEDLECLEHGEFLNDVIIDFYLKYLMLEKFPKHFAERCHIFSSFFCKCLTRKDTVSSDNSSVMPTAQRRHHKVKTWTRHVDIFTKDFIFVPVNENSHWYLAVICFPWMEEAVYIEGKEHKADKHAKPSEPSSSGSVLVFNDHLSKKEEATGEESNSGSEGSSSSPSCSSQRNPKPKENHKGKLCKRPCLLIFDSLKTGSVQTTIQVLREYLREEWFAKRKTPREFSRSTMRDLYPKVPKQTNSTDCGLYLLQYVESFSQNPIENFDPPMHLENWFPACVVKNKREEIRDLILRLHVEQSKRS
ncbi:sentrin-specific protease 7 isoform X2 [Pseudophryne corroboree]|uniref:sentrin-specific protease 7 isoform X2 n=1 Tax=Pseudophryne corroboree TaxID=495146 RepID=UPI003081D97A